MRNKLIEEFLQQRRSNYSEEEYKKISEVCRYPFKYIKKMMSRDDIPDIRIQYFGIFKPLKKRLKGILLQLEEKRKSAIVEESEYIRFRKILETRLNENIKKNPD